MSGSDENQNPLMQNEKSQRIRKQNCELLALEDIAAQHLEKKEVLYEKSSVSGTTDDHLLAAVDVQCGSPECMTTPSWLQRLTTKKTFLFVFCMSSVFQGMYYTYFVSVLTTIERLFQIRSQTTGVIMSATEVGQIGGGLLLSYYGGGGHRPRWIASGMLLFGFSGSLCALPHFLFGDVLLREFLALVPSQENPLSTANICIGPTSDSENSLAQQTFQNATLRFSVSEEKVCENAKTTHTRIVLGLFFIALLGVGVGQTAVNNLGIPYIDDNVASEESPTYFGTTIGVRIFGPTLGFVLGSVCTRLPVDPFTEPRIEPTDPRWIGAWWLGHIVISTCLILTSFLMMMFPKTLPSMQTQTHAPLHSPVRNNHLNNIYPDSNGSFESINYKPKKETSPFNSHSNSFNDLSNYWDKVASPDNKVYNEKDVFSSKLHEIIVDENAKKERKPHNGLRPDKRCLKDFVIVVRRLLTNRVLILRTASSVLHLLPIAGLYTFLPKYLETQFRLPVHSAALISGVGGILVMGVGIFFSGLVIRKLNPLPKTISGWIALTALLYSLGMIVLMFLGCSQDDIRGRIDQNGTLNFRPVCQRTCSSCNTATFAPICSSQGTTYFSACHAGCSSVTFMNRTEDMLFAECECLGEGVTAKLRLCDMSCPNFMWYVGVFCFIVIIHSTSEVGGMLVTLRCVRPQDKAMALGLISVAVGLFGNVPCPILYGAVIDHSCIHWRQSCDGRGACQIYDPNTFRTFFHGTTASVMLLAFVVDLFVWYYSKEISFLNDCSTPERHKVIGDDNETFPCLRNTLGPSFSIFHKGEKTIENFAKTTTANENDVWDITNNCYLMDSSAF